MVSLIHISVDLSNSKSDEDFTLKVNRKLKLLRTNTPPNSDFPRPFTIKEVDEALLKMKNETAAGIDGIYPELLKNTSTQAQSDAQTYFWISFQQVSSLSLSN